MSAERYEIKEKLGQGGVGAVYKALDTQLNREVAIKRVLAEEDSASQEDATKQLLKEATALSSVQHPHIVTVYDAGVDHEGPYVVMELIHGKTLDEMVERGTLTWADLSEIALQSQEALIAAQDLDLVHRDLKPSNVMVCWLPSGKFQVKIVDFGLAKFSSAPSLQTIDHGDAVFGSIFFMAPEQFERIPLDKRTDMYALGALYYYALTGIYPFNGDTAAAVMASHLQHHVTPLHELRPDIPRWGADWIMWHIERNMDDRPVDARTALERFLVLDKQSTQPVSLTAPEVLKPAASSSKLLFPTLPAANTAPSSPSPAQAATPMQAATSAQEVNAVNPVTAPQPIAPPQDSSGKLSPHTQAQQTAEELTASQQVSAPITTAPVTAAIPAPVSTAPVTPAPVSAAPIATAATTTPAVTAQLTTPPAVAAPTHSEATSVTTQAEAHTAPNSQAQEELPPTPQKPGMSNGVKWVIISVLSVAVIITAIVVFGISGNRSETHLVNEIMLEAKALEKDNKLSNGISLTEKELDGVLARATSAESNNQRNLVLAVLIFAEPEGDYDANTKITNHTISAKCSEDIREGIITTVIRRRKAPSNIAPLLEFAKSSSETKSAAAAIDAARASAIGTSADSFINDFLSLIKDTDSAPIRNAAEIATAAIIGESENKKLFSQPIINAYESALTDEAKYTILRLVGTVGGDKASQIVNSALSSDDEVIQSAAITSLSKWSDDSEISTLIEFVDNVESDTLRKRSFDAAISFLRQPRKKKLSDAAKHWQALSDVTKTQYEKLKIIQGMANQKEQWAMDILTPYLDDEDDKVIDIATKAKGHLKKRIR